MFSVSNCKDEVLIVQFFKNRILSFAFFRNMDESLRGTVGKLLVGTEARVCELFRQVLKFGACDVQ